MFKKILFVFILTGKDMLFNCAKLMNGCKPIITVLLRKN